MDRLAQVIISLGGYAVILSILGIFVFLIMEVAPLFFAPTGQNAGRFLAGPFPQSLPQATLVGVDEHQEVAYLIKAGHAGSAGPIAFFSLPSGKPLVAEHSISLTGVNVTAIARASGKGGRFGLGTDDGRVIPLAVELTPNFDKGTRETVPTVVARPPIQIDPTKDKIVRLAYQRTDAGTAAAVLTKSGRLWYSTVLPPSDSQAKPTVNSIELTDRISGPVTALVLDGRGETLSIGTAGGNLYHFDVREGTQPVLVETLSVASANTPVTALAYLIGDRSLVIGTDSGEVSVWMPVRLSKESNVTRLQLIHKLASHPAAVTGISPSQRDKGFITGDTQGNLYVHYSTSEQTLLRFPGNGIAISSLMFAPKANGAVAVTESGQIATYTIHNPHPEITFASLFQPVWYEGYERPEHVWQSSSGADDFEAKFGLTPLLFGTLKGTLYAMLLAVPIAVLAAIYTSMFMHPDLRAKIKPTIEIMAALPTVVLGFLAGLWMAPLLERIFPAVVAMFAVIPISVVLAALLWQVVPFTVRNRIRPGFEALLLMPVIIGAVLFCLSLNTQIESLLFGSDYKSWLPDTLGLRYDQRNALVVGFAMGFAIIPIIFSISEEALSNVPRNLIAGSLALGATPWQTLARLVFVSASPGIFSALMIGFGRAVGETMIVLMATGNTPIMDWSLFNGFRTLSANIAVEIPEAPHGGTLYRTLFIAALLLFVITFIVNTGAEIIRQRLRKKYSQF
ncbi:MAG: ABC transporter permease subunit [Nitrospiraceae bacterium]|nr:MAG: ABC transporter permease subunit [Nitrospiraceae bacterium]